VAPTVREALKKLRNRVKTLEAAGLPVDRFYADLIRDLEGFPPTLPMDSPRLNGLTE